MVLIFIRWIWVVVGGSVDHLEVLKPPAVQGLLVCILTAKTWYAFLLGVLSQINGTVTHVCPVEHAVPEHVLVVIDEAYFEYAQDLFPDYESAEEYLAESPNLIVTRTFSKAYGLAALRMGYSLSSVEIADFLNRVRQPFNVNSLAMTAAITALSDTQHLADTLEMNKAGIEQYHQACIELGLEWIPTAANFISINVKQNGREVFEKLLQRGIIVRPVDNYGMPDFIRITVGSKEENQRCIEALMEVLQT